MVSLKSSSCWLQRLSAPVQPSVHYSATPLSINLKTTSGRDLKYMANYQQFLSTPLDSYNHEIYKICKFLINVDLISGAHCYDRSKEMEPET